MSTFNTNTQYLWLSRKLHKKNLKIKIKIKIKEQKRKNKTANEREIMQKREEEYYLEEY